MPDLSTNLMPPERLRAETRGYVLKLVVVAVVLVTVLTIAGATLLIPLYAYLSRSGAAKAEQLSHVTSAIVPSDDTAFAARLAALTANATKLTALAKTVSPTTAIRSVLAISRPGVTLEGFTYTPPSDKRQPTLTVSGVAATRDALRNYQLALQAASFIRAASLPVSAFASDANIPFTITLTLASDGPELIP